MAPVSTFCSSNWPWVTEATFLAVILVSRLDGRRGASTSGLKDIISSCVVWGTNFFPPPTLDCASKKYDASSFSAKMPWS